MLLVSYNCTAVILSCKVHLLQYCQCVQTFYWHKSEQFLVCCWACFLFASTYFALEQRTGYMRQKQERATYWVLVIASTRSTDFEPKVGKELVKRNSVCVIDGRLIYQGRGTRNGLTERLGERERESEHVPDSQVEHGDRLGESVRLRSNQASEDRPRQLLTVPRAFL